MDNLIVPEIQFLTLLTIAAGVAMAARHFRFPYTIALVLVGIFAGLTGLKAPALTEEIILFLFLPPLLFEGSIHFNVNQLKSNAKLIFSLSLFGLIFSALGVGFMVHYLTGIPLIYCLLFGAIIMPTDPVSVLALFKKIGVPKKLSTIVEGESVFNDGVGVVLYGIIIAMVISGNIDPFNALGKFFLVVIGGLGLGVALGYLAYGILKKVDDHTIEVLISIILAYSSFIIAESFHFSGVMAVVAAGILIGNKGTSMAMSPTTRLSINNFWEIAVFVVNSLIFLMIGIAIHIFTFIEFGFIILVGIISMVLVRSLIIYILVPISTDKRDRIPLKWQHIINLGGIHGSIPIALVLGLPAMEFSREISTMVFGAVFFSLVVQGLSIQPLLNLMGIGKISEEERDYEKAFARKIALRSAIDEIHNLHNDALIPIGIRDDLLKKYEGFLEEARQELDIKLDNETLKEKKLLRAERQVLMAQRSAIDRAMKDGVIGEEAAHDLFRDIDTQLESLD